MPYKAREDQRASWRAWYARNQAAEQERKKQRQQAIIDAVLKSKLDKACIDCERFYPPYCMEYHHRPGTIKCFSIANAYKKTTSIDRLMAEIAKCDLLCANCHRIREHKNKLVRVG